MATHVERLLQTSEEVNHFLVGLARIATVNFVNEECHTHFLQFLSCRRKGILQVEELLDVYDNDAQFAIQSLDEGVTVCCFHEHRLVNVHVHHHGIQLVAQLQAVNHDHDLVVSIHAFIAIVLQLQGRPSNNVTLSKSSGVLQQKRIDVFVVEIALSQQYDFLNLLRCNPLRLEIIAKFVDIVAWLFLVVQHLRNATHNLVATELLFGAWCNQSASV